MIQEVWFAKYVKRQWVRASSSRSCNYKNKIYYVVLEFSKSHLEVLYFFCQIVFLNDFTCISFVIFMLVQGLLLVLSFLQYEGQENLAHAQGSAQHAACPARSHLELRTPPFRA